MIPVRLQLKNFLSYGSDIQIIDFSHYPLICLSGKNGHGKSALLDAITWALWGQARKIATTSKADQGLVRLGQTQMMVTLDFECANSMYRVKREYMITYGKALAILEFGIYKDDVLIPLTDKTIRTTQKKIVDTLHLDYASFSNSAFLRQGHSNEFTKKSPKDRKQILATILGITTYEEIRKAASEKVKATMAQQNVRTTLQEKYAQELEKTAATDLELKQVHQKLFVLDQEEQTLVQQQQSLLNVLQTVTQAEHAYTRAKKEYDQCLKHQDEIRKKLRQAFSQWRKTHAVIRAGVNSENLTKEKMLLIQRNQAYQQRFLAYATLKEKCLNQQHTVYTIKKDIEQRYIQATTKHTLVLQGYQTEQKHLTQTEQELEVEYRALKKECIPTISTPNANDFEKQKLTYEQQTHEYHRQTVQYEKVTTELEAIAHKEHLIKTDNPCCPLCEQNLSEPRKQFLKQKLQTDKALLTTQANNLHAQSAQLKQELILAHKNIEQTQLTVEQDRAQQHTQKKTEQRLAQLTSKLDALRTHISKLKTKQAYHTQQRPLQLVEQQKNNSEYITADAQLLSLKEQLEKTEYNTEEHKAIQQRLTEVEAQLTLLDDRQEQHKQLEADKQMVHHCCNTLRTLKQNKQTLMSELHTYQKQMDKKDDLAAKQLTLTEQLQTVQMTRNTCLEKKGRLENTKEALQKLEKEYKKQQGELVTLEKEKQDYQAIAIATGKDGIQALLIEQAIPEIEQEANAILAKLSDNQTCIMLESLRDLKKGGTKETLDIKISDTSGIRPYELFSGGEAFRIDFALRIAISKLLARRAGSAMQTLIIDEGFGSQDEQGLNNIMEAIYKIQDDFSKVIIVSHLTSMKNQFPVHFVVHKNASGSSVQVVEQG